MAPSSSSHSYLLRDPLGISTMMWTGSTDAISPSLPTPVCSRRQRTAGGSLSNVMKGFKEFILRGNVVDLAVAVVLGTAFTALVNSLVTNIFTPLIAAIIGKPDFSALTFTIN